VPPGLREAGVGAGQRHARPGAVEHRRVADDPGSLDGEAESDVGAPVVPDDGDRSYPSSRVSARTSPAVVRFEYGLWSAVVGGFEDCP